MIEAGSGGSWKFGLLSMLVILAVVSGCASEEETAAPPTGKKRQEILSNWTLWSGSGTGATVGPFGIGGTVNRWLYTSAPDAGVEYGPIEGATINYYPVPASTRESNLRPAVTNSYNSGGSVSVCQMVGFTSPGGAFAWGVEVYNLIADVCELTSVNTVSGTIDSAPAIASYVRTSGGVIYYHYWVFAARASDGAILYNHFVGTSATSGSWSGWSAKTDTVLKSGSSLAVVSRAENSIDIFAVGTDDVLYTRNLAISYPGGTETLTWANWSSLGGEFSSDPAVHGEGNFMTVCGNGLDTSV